MVRYAGERAFASACLLAGLVVAVSALLALRPAGLPGLGVSVEHATIGVLVVSCGGCLATAWRARGRLRWSWLLLGTMMALYAAGDTLWLAFADASGNAPILSLADLCYLLALAPGALGLVLYPVTRGLRLALGPVALDAAVLAASALLVSHVLVFRDVLASTSGILDSVMVLVYPVTDVLLTCLVLVLLLRSVGQARVDVVLLGATFALYSVADNGWMLSTAQGWDYGDSLVAVVYVAAPVCLALAALSVALFSTGPRLLHRQLSGVWAPALPDLATLLSLAVAFVGDARDPATGVLVAVVLVLAGVRQLAGTRQAHGWRLELEQRVQQRTSELAQLSQRHRQLEVLKYGFVSAVSHELRTPLTAIRGSLEMLSDGDAGELPDEARTVVAVAERGTVRLSRLVNDIIDLERLESGEFRLSLQPLELRVQFEEAAASMLPLARSAGVRLELSTVTPAVVMADSDRLQQALVNLIGNAVKFTPPQGRVTLASTRRGNDVVVEVADQGRGIPTDQLDAVFDRFHQVQAAGDQAKGGTGLGLTITQHIVRAHGGDIWAESEVGRGTVFRFTLPAVVAASAPSPDPPALLPEDPLEEPRRGGAQQHPSPGPGTGQGTGHRVG